MVNRKCQRGYKRRIIMGEGLPTSGGGCPKKGITAN